jgi:hypothetical protein
VRYLGISTGYVLVTFRFHPYTDYYTFTNPSFSYSTITKPQTSSLGTNLGLKLEKIRIRTTTSVKYKAGIIRLTHFSIIMQLSGFYIQPESTQNTQDPKSGSVPDLDLVQLSGQDRILTPSKYTGLFNLCFNHQRDHRLIFNVVGSPHLP